MSVSDTEEEMREIYEIELPTSRHFHHYKQGKPGCLGMAEPPFGSGLSDSMDGRHRL